MLATPSLLNGCGILTLKQSDIKGLNKARWNSWDAQQDRV